MVLGDLGNSADRLTVEPLTPAAVAALAKPLGMDADDLFRKSAGNPFFVTEALASGSSEIPGTVYDTVLARAARLSPQARKLLEAVAIVPSATEDWLLHALHPDAPDHLDECLDSGNLVADGRNISFRHELARLVIIDSISPIRRGILHKAALRALKEVDDDAHLARLAHHADLAGDTDAVLRFAPAAAKRAAELGAHREAAAQYARALRFAEGRPLETRAELLERYSYECFLTDRSDEAIEARERAIVCYRKLRNKVREGDSLRWLSRLVGCRGRAEEVREFGRAAVQILESCPPSPELAMAYSNLAADFAESEDREGARAWGHRAIDLAKRFDDTETYAHALNSMGLTSFLVGEESGRQELEESLEISLREGLEEHAARAFIHLAAAASRTRSPQLTHRYLDQGMDYCVERDLDLWRMYLLAFGARSDIDRGRWSAAVAAAGQVPKAGLPSTLPRLLALVAMALVRARRGDYGHEALLEEAAGLVVPGEFQSVGVVAAARAEISWLTGNHDAVAGVTQEAYDIARRLRSPWPVGELAYCHVSAILGKLGVANRGQASAKWVRLGLGSKDR